MAEITEMMFPFRKIIGRIGNMKYYTRNGKQFVREYKPQVRTTKVTEKEIAHRKRFGIICSAAGKLRNKHEGLGRSQDESKRLYSTLGAVYDELAAQEGVSFGADEVVAKWEADGKLKVLCPRARSEGMES